MRDNRGSFLDQLFNHRWIGQGRNITEVFGFHTRDLAQNPTHDLSGSCFWQSRRNEDLVGYGNRTDMRAHFVTQFADELGK